MNCIKIILIILVIFFKTGNVLSSENIFNVNNIEISKKKDVSNKKLVNSAIKKGFNELTDRILLNEDKKKIAYLEFSQIKDLVLYYKVSRETENKNKSEKLIFNIFFDREKIHDLFFAKGILYSNITNKNFYLLPILKKNEEYNIFNKNFFYNHWNTTYKTELLDFNLLSENIEIIQKVNLYKNNILDLNLNDIFREYLNENLSLIILEEKDSNEIEVYLKNKILDRNFVKRLKFIKDKSNKNEIEFYKKIITEIKKELVNIVKSQNLIDVRTPSFLNVKLTLSKKNNLEELNARVKKIDLIERVFVKEFNKKNVFLKIKYLGKLDKMIKSLEEQDIILKLLKDQWSLTII